MPANISHNDYVLKNMFGSFFLATLMSALMNQLGSITDSIIVSHLISPDALSVTRLWGPFMSAIFIIISLIGAGADYLATRAIGGQDYQKVNRVFNSELFYTAATSLLIVCLLLPYTDQLCHLITTNERLSPYLKSYIYANYLSVVVIMLAGVPVSYVINNGSPKLITRSIIISQVLNIAFDLLFCGVFGLGLAGASLATTLSTLLAFTSLTKYITKHANIFKVRRPTEVCSIAMYKQMAVVGAPMMIAAVLDPVSTYLMNTLIVNRMGADGMYTFTVYFQTIGICMLVLAGTNSAIVSIGGILQGENDHDSFKMLTKRIFRLLHFVIIPVSLLIFIFPDILTKLFGASEELAAQSRTPLRLLSLFLYPMAMTSTLQGMYYVEGHHKLCRWYQLILNIGTLVFICLMALFSPELLWYGMPFIGWLLLALLLSMAYAVSRKRKTILWPTLQSKLPTNVAVAVSVPYTKEGVENLLKTIKPFIQACELKEGLSVEIALEELLYEVIEADSKHKPNETFDLRIVDTVDKFTIVVKSKGTPLNPIYKYANSEIETIDNNNFRRAILTRLCDDITHKYMNGINCIYLNYQRQASPAPQTAAPSAPPPRQELS